MYRKNQMIGSWKIGIVLFLFTFLVIGVLPAQGTLTWIGPVTPDPTGAPDPWDIISLIVGDGADGWLSIGSFGDPNTVNVSGSAWVGYANDISLPSSKVKGQLIVHGQTGAVGSTLTVGQNLTIGAAMVDPNDWDADGLLEIYDGGVVDVTGDLILAYDANSENSFYSWGWLEVYEPNSLLNLTGDLYLSHGEDSYSETEIYNGGVVDVNGNAYLAYGENSEGYLYVYNPNSRLNLTGSDLYLGYGDDSFSYTYISDGGVVDVAGNAYLAYDANSTGYLVVSDSNSRLDVGGNLYAADGNGASAYVDVNDGGVVDVNVDAHFGSGSGRVYMTNDQPEFDDYGYMQTYVDIDIYDPNSLLNVGGDLYIADGNGANADFDIYLGGVVDVVGDTRIGGDRDTYVSRDYVWPEEVDWTSYDDSQVWMKIYDPNSRLNVGGNLYVADGNNSYVDVDIWGGGVVDVGGDAFIGYGEGSEGYVDVQDSSSQFNYGGMLYLGYGTDSYGQLDTWGYSDANSPFTVNAIVGYGEGSTGILNIQDANWMDSTFSSNADGDFILGNGDGSYGYMYIEDVNRINVARDLILARGDGSGAMMEIYDSNIYYINTQATHIDIGRNLYLGYGDGSWAGGWGEDPFEIHDRMVVDVNDVYLGYGENSRGAMYVDGKSRLNYKGRLYIGYGGEGQLDINYGWAGPDDSPVELDAILGYLDGSSGTLNIWDVNNQDLNLSSNANGDFIVGDGNVTIYDVNRINVSGDLFLAKNDDSSAVMTFDNANSLDVGGTLYLGYGEDSDADLHIREGISVNVNQDVFVDYGPGYLSSISSELIIDRNSRLDVGGDLWVGYGTNSVGSVFLDNAVLDVNNNIILGFQSHSYGKLSVIDDSDLIFDGQMFVGYGGHGELEIKDVDTLDLDEDVVFFGYGAGSSANVEIYDVNRVNVDGNLNLAYGQDSWGDMRLDHVNDVNIAGDLNLAHGQDSWGAMRLSHVNDVDITGDLNLAYGQDSNVPKVWLTNVNMSVGGDLNLGYGAGSTFGTLNVLDSRVDVGNSLFMGYGGTADEMIITRSFVGVGSNPYDLDDYEGLSIGADGTLAGEGRIWGDVYNKGTIAPGSSIIGTLNIVGDLTFDVNSVYAVDIADSDNSSDKIEVKGDLFINGGTVEVTPTETITQNRQYTIAEAHSVTNTDGWDSNDVIVTAPSVLLDVEDPNLVVGDTDVVLGVKPLKFGEAEVLQTESGNQAALGGALDQIIIEEGGNDVTYALQQIVDTSDLLEAYNQLGNQTRPPMNSITSDVSMGFLGVMGERLRGIGPVAGRGYRSGRLLAMSGPASATSGISPYGTMGTMADGYNNPVVSAMAVGRGSPVLSNRRWGLWTKGYGVFGDRDSKSGVTGHDYRVGGLGAGLDYMFTDAFLAGLTLGYSEGDVGYEGLRDNTDIGSTNLGAYASYEQDSWYIDAMFGYGKHEYDSIRYVDLVSERLTASYDGQSLNGYLELGLNWRETETSLLQPLVGLQIGHVTIDSYQESGGSTAVGVDKTDYDSIKSSLGLKYTHMFGAMTDGLDGSVQLRGRWLHELGDDNSSVDTYFTSNPDAVYKMQDAKVNRESALLGGSLSINISEQTLATIQYDVRLNSDETTQFIGGSLQYRW